MQSGIYKITNTITGRFYIGSAVNFRKRWREHIIRLRRKTHHCAPLQNSWHKHGEDAFVFEVLELVCRKDLLDREQGYLSNLTRKIAFNISTRAGGGDIISSHPNRAQIIKKISLGQALRASMMTPDEKTARYVKLGSKNPNFGNKWNDEQRDRASKKHKLLGVPQSTIDKLIAGTRAAWEDPTYRMAMRIKRTGSGNSFHGKKHSNETKEKISKSMSGVKPINQMPIKIDGTIYPSMTEASRQLGIPVPTISFRIKSKSNRFANYTQVE